MALRVDREFQSLLPELTSEELSGLEKSILANGCLDPVVVWAGHGVILDGHNRFAICSKHKLAFNVAELSMETREEAMDWIAGHALNRRNLTDEQRAYFRGRKYLEKKRPEGRPPKNIEEIDEKKLGHNVPVILRQSEEKRTSEPIGGAEKVNEKTVRRDAEFAQAVDKLANGKPEVREKILSGKSGLSKKDAIKAAKLPDDEREQAAAAILAGDPIEEPAEPEVEKPVPLLDRIGCVIPIAALETFAVIDKFKQAMTLHRQLSQVVTEIAEAPGGEVMRKACILLERSGKQSLRLDRLYWAGKDIQAAQPYAARCPYCVADGRPKNNKDCRCCLGRPYVTKQQFDQAPKDYQDMVRKEANA